MTSSHSDPRDQPLLPSSNCCNKLPPYCSLMTMFYWRQLTFQKLSTQFATLLQKSCLDLPDQIYNWIVSYFTNRKHVTRHLGIISSLATINARIVLGSVIGLASYIVVSSDLHPLHSQNVLVKYADDTYLLVVSKHISTAKAEFQHGSCHMCFLNVCTKGPPLPRSSATIAS